MNATTIQSTDLEFVFGAPVKPFAATIRVATLPGHYTTANGVDYIGSMWVYVDADGSAHTDYLSLKRVDNWRKEPTASARKKITAGVLADVAALLGTDAGRAAVVAAADTAREDEMAGLLKDVADAENALEKAQRRLATARAMA